MNEPVVDKPEIPREYGNPTQRLEWAGVERRLESASVYWIASTSPTGGRTSSRATARGSTAGSITEEEPTEAMAARLSDAPFAKYPQYGRTDPSIYLAGVSVLRPRRVLAWTSFTENATRFRFEER